MTSSKLLKATSPTCNSTDLYNDTFTMMTMTTTPIPTTSCETLTVADAIEKTTATGTTTLVEASTTTTPAAKTAGSATETAIYRTTVLNATNYCGTKTLTETREDAIPIATAAPTTPATTALDKARPHLPLKPGLYVSSHRTTIRRWRTC